MDNELEEEHDFSDQTSTTKCDYSPQMELIKQGAEAKLYRATYLGRSVVVKERFCKKYRHPTLDTQLTKDRIKGEVRCIARCRQHGIQVPVLYLVDPEKSWIIMEYIENSITVRDYIVGIYENHRSEFERVLTPLAKEIGRIIATMHKNNVIHGDLTTSNMLLRLPAFANDNPESNEANGLTPVQNQNQAILEEGQIDVCMIDFGLSYSHHLAEDKGVDVYVLEKAFVSTHPNSEKVFDLILESYWKSFGKGAEGVRKKLEEVRLRGRKRIMIG